MNKCLNVQTEWNHLDWALGLGMGIGIWDLGVGMGIGDWDWGLGLVTGIRD